MILKYQEDVDRVRGDIADTLVERAERGNPQPSWSYLERTPDESQTAQLESPDART